MTQDALPEGMRLISKEPLNAETDLGKQRGVLTPSRLWYHRNHFPFPELRDQVISVSGEVELPFELHLGHVLAMQSRTLLATMECAGNGRSGLQPKADGEPWEYAAVSTAEWTGIPLRDVLERAGVRPHAKEILFVGADRGHVEATGADIPFARSLPIKKAMDPDVILAHAMNGEGLDFRHGGNIRLIVPGWYGMASVKWVTRIEAIAQPFLGFYQTDRYVMPDASGHALPLGAIRVRSVIASPSDGSQLTPGHHLIRGMAWSGNAPVTRVDVSIDGGQTWSEAHLASREERYAWRRWEYGLDIELPGTATILSRAFDAAGNSQPAVPEWNRLGYANNAVQAITVQVIAP
jgi:DMSO/TMAO reductase YedYZ molybdopterin-dependent catalytic subunit